MYDLKYPVLDPEVLEQMQQSIARFNKRVGRMGLRLREKRLNQLGISTGIAPGPFPGSIDV